MTDDTKHVTPSAARTLSEKPLPPELELARVKGEPKGRVVMLDTEEGQREFGKAFKLTRGTPIEKLPEDKEGYVPYTEMIAKLNELIDRINQMNEL